MNVGLFPTMDISVRNIKHIKIDPTNCAFFTGKEIVFVGTGTSPIDGNSVDPTLMTWNISNEDGVTGKQTFSGYAEITVNSSEIEALGQGTGDKRVHDRRNRGECIILRVRRLRDLHAVVLPDRI